MKKKLLSLKKHLTTLLIASCLVYSAQANTDVVHNQGLDKSQSEWVLASEANYEQDSEAQDYTFLKTIDKVDIYFKQVFCEDNVEYLIIKAINKSTDSVSLNLQPTFKLDDTSFSSKTSLSFTLSGGATIIGDCNTLNLKVDIFEFFTQYDPTLMKFDLTKI